MRQQTSSATRENAWLTGAVTTATGDKRGEGPEQRSATPPLLSAKVTLNTNNEVSRRPRTCPNQDPKKCTLTQSWGTLLRAMSLAGKTSKGCLAQGACLTCLTSDATKGTSGEEVLLVKLTEMAGPADKGGMHIAQRARNIVAHVMAESEIVVSVGSKKELGERISTEGDETVGDGGMGSTGQTTKAGCDLATSKEKGTTMSATKGSARTVGVCDIRRKDKKARNTPPLPLT